MDRGSLTGKALMDAALEGARKALKECLSLEPGDEVALFSDETTVEPANILEHAAREFDIGVRRRSTPVAIQRTFQKGEELPIEDIRALQGVRAVITCISSDPNALTYRMALVENGTDLNTRLGHMPGATVELLASAVNIDYDAAVRRCDALALAMTFGNKARLRTYELDVNGEPIREYDLLMDLGSRKRYPVVSSGIIPLHTWGNLPGGETFIAPIEFSADGTFVLNGSFKQHVIGSEPPLLLRFEGGQLTQIDGPEKTRLVFDLLLEKASVAGDKHFKALAELGIGVNGGIAALTGHPLSDEKVDGTAHIALGRNVDFGGNLDSLIHEDVVTWQPSLFVDDSSILDHGKFVFDVDRWCERLDCPDIWPLDRFMDAPLTFEFCRNSSQELEVVKEMLRLRHWVTTNRICTYTVGQPQASRILARLVHHLPENTNPISLARWISASLQDGVDELTARRAMDLLERHGLVEQYIRYAPF